MNYLEIIRAQDFEKAKRIFESKRPKFVTEDQSSGDAQEKALKEYDPYQHDVFNPDKRPDKIILKDTDSKDENGDPITQKIPVPVSRIAVALQQLIVNRRTGFMLGDPVKMDAIYSSDNNQAETNLVALIERIQNDNKMDYTNKELARRLMSELEVAEIWYLADNKDPLITAKYNLKVKVISPLLGDKLYPLFDETGDMVAFGRGYIIFEGDNPVNRFDIYTEEFEYKLVSRQNKWDLDAEAPGGGIIPNKMKKIPVIYYQQPISEWENVQPMINRFETLISNHADLNDYFGSPILAVMGEIEGFAQKGEQGKILQLSSEAKANYLTLSSPPESIKMELDNLNKLIYSMSQTPDISFEQMISLTGAISGVALKLMFIDAHMAVRTKEEIFGRGLQRRFNFLKVAIGNIVDTSLSAASRTLQVKPRITPYLPQNIAETVDILSVATTNGLMSKETAITQNPLISDPETELLRVKEDTTNQLVTGQ